MADEQIPGDLKAVVQRMIDAGESEDNIGKVIQHYHNVVVPEKATREMASPKIHTGLDGKPYITDDPNDVQGYGDHLLQNMQQSALDPMVGLTADIKVPALAAKAIGQAAGGVSELAAPVLKDIAGTIRLPVGKALSGVGRGLEAAGAASKPFSMLGALEEAARSGSLTHGVLAGALPYAAQTAGKVLQRGGAMLGAVTPEVSAAAERGAQMAAGPSAIDRLAALTTDAPKAAPPMPAPAAPGDAEAALKAMKAPSTDLRAFLLNQSPAAAMPNPVAAQAAQTMAKPVVPPTEAPSSLMDQLHASLADRQAQLARPGKVSIADVPPSRSRGVQGAGSAPSATPGLTRNDLESVGLNPDVKVTALSPDLRDKILASRKSRGASYAEQAALATRLNALLANDR